MLVVGTDERIVVMDKPLSMDKFHDVEEVLYRSCDVAGVFGGKVQALFKDEYAAVIIECKNYSMWVKLEYGNPMLLGYLPDSGNLKDCPSCNDGDYDKHFRKICFLNWDKFFGSVLEWFKGFTLL